MPKETHKRNNTPTQTGRHSYIHIQIDTYKQQNYHTGAQINAYTTRQELKQKTNKQIYKRTKIDANLLEKMVNRKEA